MFILFSSMSHQLLYIHIFSLAFVTGRIFRRDRKFFKTYDQDFIFNVEAVKSPYSPWKNKSFLILFPPLHHWSLFFYRICPPSPHSRVCSGSTGPWNEKSWNVLSSWLSRSILEKQPLQPIWWWSNSSSCQAKYVMEQEILSARLPVLPQHAN